MEELQHKLFGAALKKLLIEKSPFKRTDDKIHQHYSFSENELAYQGAQPYYPAEQKVRVGTYKLELRHGDICFFLTDGKKAQQFIFSIRKTEKQTYVIALTYVGGDKVFMSMESLQ